METKAICTRFSEQTIFKLDWLCETLGQKRSEVLSSLVSDTFDQMNGNEELKALFGQMKDIERQMHSLVESIK